jgi:hypothetical protein
MQQAKNMEIGTRIRVHGGGPAIVLVLGYGRKPWKSGKHRYSHAEVDGSLAAGEAQVLTDGREHVAAV